VEIRVTLCPVQSIQPPLKLDSQFGWDPNSCIVLYIFVRSNFESFFFVNNQSYELETSVAYAVMSLQGANCIYAVPTSIKTPYIFYADIYNLA